MRERKRLVITLAILAAMCSLLIFFGKVSAWDREVKFRGVVTTDEQWKSTVCYGSYYCNVSIQEILYDPNDTLSLGDNVTICYNESLSLKTGDPVECYGINYINDSTAPKQCSNKIMCRNAPYYVITEFPSFLVLPLFMISTLLAVVVYRRKHSMYR